MSQSASLDTNPDESPIVVVGAGFVGVATALWLQREGRKVVLIDKAKPQQRASFGNAGVLAASSILPVTMPGLLGKIPRMVMSNSEPIFLRWSYLLKLMPWAVRYLSHTNEKDVRRIAAALEPILADSLADHQSLAKGTEPERFIKPCDFAVLFKDRATYEKDPLPWDIRRDNGFTWAEVEGTERDLYDSVFAHDYRFLAALGGHGQITDPGGYLASLVEHFIASGGVHLHEQVIDIAHENGHVTGVRTNTDFVAAAKVAITAGAWSPLLTKQLGVRIPVEAESGYHLDFWNASKMPRVPTLVPNKKFILTPMEGRLRIAGAVEFGGVQNEGSEAPFELLKEGVKQLLPDLSYSEETRWMGHRPAPTDSIPVIDELPHMSGLFLGFGHQHVGLTGSARTGQLLAQMICGETPSIEMADYRVTRFL